MFLIFSDQKIKTILLLIMLLGSSGLQSSVMTQDTRPYELDLANKQLNDTYKKIMSKLQVSERSQLRKAQRQWLIFRDLDCAWAYGAEPLDCLVDRTENRVSELKTTLFFNINNGYTTFDD